MASTNDIAAFTQQCAAKTIAELAHITGNPHHYTPEQLAAAQHLLNAKRADWKDANQEKLRQLDQLLRQRGWDLFRVANYDGWRLTIIAGADLAYNHQVSIVFEDVAFVSMSFEHAGFYCDTAAPMLESSDRSEQLARQYQIDPDHQVFVFHEADENKEMIIAANAFSFLVNGVGKPGSNE